MTEYCEFRWGQTIAGTTQLESVVTETKNVRRAKIGVISVKKCVRAPSLVFLRRETVRKTSYQNFKL